MRQPLLHCSWLLLVLLVAVHCNAGLTKLSDGGELNLGDCLESPKGTHSLCLSATGTLDIRTTDKRALVHQEGLYKAKKGTYKALLKQGTLAIFRLDKKGYLEVPAVWDAGAVGADYASLSEQGVLTLYQSGYVRDAAVWSTSREVATPPRKTDLVEPATGIVLWPTDSFNGSPPLTCVGLGVRTVPVLYFSSVHVYVMGLYIDAVGARKALKAFLPLPAEDLAQKPEFYSALLKPGVFTRYIVLAFNRKVSTLKVADALTAVEGVPPPIVEAYRRLLEGALGEKGARPGDTLALGFEGKDRLVVVANGKTHGAVRSAVLPAAVFKLYLGDDPIIPAAKRAVADGVAKLNPAVTSKALVAL
eukprot:TRINITY_DN5099_c0_g1_i1.p1 TRINITY_DN5099_c0_g1~~TRINITY_DN5099_c0_g1_i1.p1  ORF type:complete len:361 (-),score=127.07 TRINITY_DN5099_c0_g1_i1:334-1416(-)